MDEERLERPAALANLRRLLSESLPGRGLLLACLLGSLASALVKVFLPQVVRAGIDHFMVASGATAGRLDGLKQLAATYAGLLLVGLVIEYSTALGLNRVGQGVVRSMRSRIWSKFHRLPIQFFDQNAVGRLVTRVANDTNALAELFTNVLASGLADFFLFFGILSAMLYLEPGLTAILFLLCPFLVALTFWFKRVAQALYRELRVLLARVNAFFGETVQGITIIKSLSAQQVIRERFGLLNQECYNNEMDIIHRQAIFRPIFAISEILASALVLIIGGRQILAGDLTMGGLVAFLFYLRMLFSPLQEMAEKFNVFQKAVIASERLFRILDSDSEPGLDRPSNPPPPTGSVRFDKVSFAYDPEKPVLHEVSFEVEAGQKVALVGPTGSGKTTITGLLLGFYPLAPESGQIEVDGQSLEGWNLTDLRNRIGFVHQDLFLFSGDIRRNLTLFGDIPEQRLEQALRVSRAEGVVHRFEKGLDHELGEGGNDLSQGERQLLSFARALAREPGILILDEATASIDSKTEAAINQALEQLLEGRTALIIAHRLATVKNVDKIIVLQEGRVVEEGNHEQLLAADGLYALMFRSQTI
ncbi:MAG: ABC transporter ATP-binding protein [Candidatus Eremiobacteraeota bacterium]|nr:ABC transporter ATP-binding protein [Candidatus Eremiobacteraeota bacterium]